MATANRRNLCVKCNKEKAILNCEGCSQKFCYNHFDDHRQELNKQMDELEVIRDIIREKITEEITEPRKHAVIELIDQWEKDSINKIRQTADEARQLLQKHTAEHVAKNEVHLNKLTCLLQQGRQQNDFIETDISEWKEELTQLTQQLAKPSNIKLQQDSISLVNKIYVDIPSKLTSYI